MAKAAKKAVKAKPKRKPAKKRKPAPARKRAGAKTLAESRRGRSKAQAFANANEPARFVSVDDLTTVYERLDRQAEDLARVRRFVGESTGTISRTLPGIHTAVDRLCKDHAAFRAAIDAHVIPMIGQVRELVAFRREAMGVIMHQAESIRQLKTRFDALDQLLRS